jgi:predicted RNA-binding Zn-ribbon protein involved in translation (DUF1610 family)
LDATDLCSEASRYTVLGHELCHELGELAPPRPDFLEDDLLWSWLKWGAVRALPPLKGIATMTAADAHMVKFQCPKCGHEVEQTIGNLKLSEHMRCPGCGVGINIDTNRLANAAEEIQRAMDKTPAEITIKFFR